MPTLKFNVFDLMPRSAQHYVLPAVGLPVTHRQVEVGRTDVAENGDFELEVSGDLSRDIKTGNAIILPTSKITSPADGISRLLLISVEIHFIADTFK